jgi:Zn-dependent protease with chaperone function
MHEDLIRSARRRLWGVAAFGVLVLGLTVTLVVLPVAWVLGAISNPLGTGLGFGWGLLEWALVVSLVIGLSGAAIVFTWSLLDAEASALGYLQAWPGPKASNLPPPTLDVSDIERVEKILEVLSLAAGVRAPRVAAVIDDAPNCLTIGRSADRAWIVVTTGLVELLPKRELEAVLAYELGRVVELEVSLDTVVYALTSHTFEVWAAAFDDVDEMSILLLPLGLLALPFFMASLGLRGAVIRNRARLADGLAVRYVRDPGALARALRNILDNRDEARLADPANAHLWLEYPHSRMSRWFLRTHRILPKRIRRLERLAGPAAPMPGEPVGD